MLTRILSNQSAFSALLVFLTALALKIALFFLPLPWITPSLVWSVAGARWWDGFTTYSEIYTSLDPFAVLFYGIFSAWAEHPFFHVIGSFIFITIIAFYFNYILNKHKVFQRNNFYPAFFILVLTSLYPDQILLSPALIGAAISLPSIDMMITHFRQEQKEEYFFRMGLLVGIAAQFFHGYWWMLIMLIVVSLLFSVSNPRKIFLLLLGALFPLLFISIYYFWINNLDNWYHCNIQYWVNWPDKIDYAFINLLKISILPGILILFSFFALASVRFIHFQYRVLQLHIAWLIFSVLIFWFNADFGIYNLIVLAIPLSYFLSHLFMSIKNGFIRETFFLGTVGGIFVIYFYVLLKGDATSKAIFVYQDPLPKKGKVLLLSDSIQYAIQNEVCGPYVEWNRFNTDFRNLQNYQSLSHIYGTIHNEAPSIIVDGDGFLLKLKNRIPEIEKNYSTSNGKLYFRKN